MSKDCGDNCTRTIFNRKMKTMNICVYYHISNFNIKKHTAIWDAIAKVLNWSKQNYSTDLKIKSILL